MKITEGKADAYRNTEYCVFAPTGTIRLSAYGESPELAELHKSFDVTSSAFITAYSPQGQSTEEGCDKRNQEHLVADVSSRWQLLPGEGADPQGEWPPEPSLLVLGICLDDAMRLGRKYQQHAIVFGTFGGQTKLYACDPENQSALHPLK